MDRVLKLPQMLFRPSAWRTPFAQSVLVHVTLFALLAAFGFGLAFWRSSNSMMGTDAIEVQMTDVHVHHDEPKFRSRVQTTIQKNPSTEGEVRADQASEGVEESPSQSEAFAPLTPGGSSQSYLAQLSALIARHQFYPRAAILNEQEGIVKIKLSITAAGELAELVVIESSGHIILDEAARTTLQRIKTYPLPEGVKQGIRLVVPIRYEINPSH